MKTITKVVASIWVALALIVVPIVEGIILETHPIIGISIALFFYGIPISILFVGIVIEIISDFWSEDGYYD